jgi:uncharacterized caspase-like protein
MTSFASERGVGGVTSLIQEDEQGDLYLLTIGVDDYLYWPKLRTAVNDVRAFTKILRTDYGFSQKNVKTLYNQDATRSNIIKSLRDFAEKLFPSDSLVIFYAGHGNLDKLTGKGSWVPVDGSKEDTTSWIKNTNIKDILAVIKAKHILLISDSCFAGDIFRGTIDISTQKGGEYARSVFMKKSRFAMTSGGLEPVTDEGPENHSVFAYHLLKALERQPAEQILTSELFVKVEQGLKLDKVAQQPILDVLRKTGAEPEGQFVFFRSKPVDRLDTVIFEKQKELSEAVQQQESEKKKLELQIKQIGQKKKKLESIESQIAQIRVAQRDYDDRKTSSLDQIYAVALQKQQQTEEIARLQQKVRLAEEKRLRKIMETAAEQAANRKKDFYRDYHKYLKILEMNGIEFEFKRQAWKELCEAWQVQAAGFEPGYFKWKDNRPVVFLARGDNAYGPPMVLGSSDLIEPGGWYGEVSAFENGRTRGMELGNIVEPGGYFGEESSRMRGEFTGPIPKPGGEFYVTDSPLAQ